MADLTAQTVALGAASEGTQALAPAECAVCGTANPPGEVWCQECGFRLGDEPGEAPAGQPVEVGGLVLLSTGQRYPLHEGRNEIGRDALDVPVSDPSVSRRHAVVVVEPGAAFIEDLGSTNGTWVGGERLTGSTGHALRHGQEIRLGAAALRVELSEPYRSETPPEAESSPEATESADLVLRGPGGLEFPLPEGTWTVGRRAENTISLPDPYVSGRHAQVTREGAGVLVTDLGSTNGTFVRGERLLPQAPAPLSPGESVSFGRSTLTLEWTRPPEAPGEDNAPAQPTAPPDREPGEPGAGSGSV